MIVDDTKTACCVSLIDDV